MGKRRRRREVLTAVEIGTRSIKVVIGEFHEDHVLTLLGIGEEPSMKVMKGEIGDPQTVQKQLDKALVAAEDAAGEPIKNVFLAVTGSHLGSVNSIGSTIIHSYDPHITAEDVELAEQNVWNCTLPPDREILHRFRRQYLVDGREVDNPVGLFGGKLEADGHIIFGQQNRLNSSRHLITEAIGTEEDEPKAVVFSGVAAALGVLGPEETEKGAMVIDLGAGVTEYAVFTGEARCLHSGQVTVGCEHLANDLSLALQLPVQRCRELVEGMKDLGAKARMTQDGGTRMLDVEPTPGKPLRKIPVATVEHVVELRLQELFQIIRHDLESKDMLKRIGSGIRLTGGGALIPEILDLARQIFDMPVTLGTPRLVNGPKEIINSPRYATPIGILRFGRTAMANLQPPVLSLFEQLRQDILSIFRLLMRWRPFNW